MNRKFTAVGAALALTGVLFLGGAGAVQASPATTTTGSLSSVPASIFPPPHWWCVIMPFC